MIGLIIP